jgi:sugar lactone lactonase YvrE
MNRIFVTLVGALLAVHAVWVMGFQEPPTAAALNADAIKAYQAKDYKSFLALEKRALELDPANPRVVYNVACGESLAGNAYEAVRRLDQLLALKLDLGADTDPDFTSIRNTEDWIGFQSRLAELRKPLVHSHVAFRLPDPEIVATGIAVDPRTGDTYIASVRQRTILRRTKDGALSNFISQGQDGFLAGASLAIDPARKLLFATTSAVPYMVGYSKEDSGRSGVFAFDLHSGKLIRKAMLPADGKRHFLNAMAFDLEGNVYVSDSGSSGIYLVRAKASELEVFIPANVFRAAQGLAFSADQKTLYVADFADGLWAVDLSSKNRRHLDVPAGVWLQGLDGLSRAHDGFIAVQIGPKPERVLRIRLDPRGTRVTNVEILEMSHPDYEGPIQGTVSENEFLYVANSQLDLGNGETGSFAADRAHPTVVLRLPL